MHEYSQEELLFSINEKRQMMVEAAELYGYTGDETIKRSQELDQLIYQYQKVYEEPVVLNGRYERRTSDE
ncbi:aspartyl-phosphate phosphatase Spo0E family protein [Bacillus sonorensis]|uniref:aspartyl-phosphate phosphatase Spo0E family protein n=1 Tax=Bacillus sonorensis TaxID=119858 RepID=UPI00227F8DE4|nr:aspartyl-phosphate phosphatase Spo0E family protein [Bacillus sonorensis]MCY8271958.1 aspartyl-phosphate phosphatase Spo0E family protein [Bacillus sonorensis]